MLVSFLLTSCVPVRPLFVGKPVSQIFADGLMQDWSECSAKVTSVQGLAKVKVHTPDDSLNGTQVILAEQPDRLRAETLSPFGSPLLTLATDGEKLGVLLPSRNLFYTGASTAENLGRFVRIPMPLTDLLSVLLYQPPLIDARNEEAYELQENGWLLVRRNFSQRQELTFNSERQLIEVRYFEADSLFMKVHYGQFLKAGECFPQFYGIDLPGQKTVASLEFSDLQTNGELRPGIFQLTPPPGVTIVSLDE
jgi:outer membrane lipoprotein-sorting protein